MLGPSGRTVPKFHPGTCVCPGAAVHTLEAERWRHAGLGWRPVAGQPCRVEAVPSAPQNRVSPPHKPQEHLRLASADLTSPPRPEEHGLHRQSHPCPCPWGWPGLPQGFWVSHPCLETSADSRSLRKAYPSFPNFSMSLYTATWGSAGFKSHTSRLERPRHLGPPPTWERTVGLPPRAAYRAWTPATAWCRGGLDSVTDWTPALHSAVLGTDAPWAGLSSRPASQTAGA